MTGIIISVIASFVIALIIVKFTIRKKWLKIVLLFLLPIIITPILYFIITLSIAGFARDFNDQEKFNSKKWTTDKSFRLKYGKDLESSGILINKSKTDIEKLLGEPDIKNYEAEVENHTYLLDKDTWRDGYINVFLTLEFQNDTVVFVNLMYD